MKKILVDTNAILRFLLNDVPTQRKRTEELFKKAAKKKVTVILPEIVVFEILFTLDKYYGYSKEQIIKIIEPLVATAYLRVESRRTFLGALKIFRMQNIEFVDCFLAIKSIEANGDLFTFDQKLLKLSKALNK